MEPQAEQTFFDDPALDRAMGMIMSLATELYIVRDRLRCLEQNLVSKGFLDPAELDAYKPTVEEAMAIDADRDAFIAELLGYIQGTESSQGAE